MRGPRAAEAAGGHGSLSEAAKPVACCAPLVSRSMTTGEAEATSSLFKALADPHRVRIVNLIANAVGPVCVCDITAEVGLSQPTVSFHLKKLFAAGLLEREERGVWAYYSINRPALHRLGMVFETSGEES